MASQTDVARLAKVSFMTVSRVINNHPHVRPETRERVLRAIRELSYYPNAAARALNSSKSRNIGIVFPKRGSLLSFPFFVELCVEVELLLRAKGYHLFLASSETEAEAEALPALFRKGRVDGLILLSPSEGDRGIEGLLAEGLPFVVVHGSGDQDRYPSVDSDNRKGTSLLMRHLYDLGHRRIGFVTGDLDSSNARDRLEGYRAEMEASGGAFDDSLVAEGDWSLEGGHRALQALVSLPVPPTAILFSNDQMAIGGLKAAADRGIGIPEELSIVGYDDIKYAAFTLPPLTTVRQDIAAVGAGAVELLLGSMEGHPRLRRLVIEPELVLRSSSRSIL